jgi:glyoxylase-like metal-dependent hydrolase (beta-lactamase superfamily II)
MPSDDFLDARAALAACPVGAIRSTTQAEIVLASSSDTMGEASAVNEQVETSKAFSINPKFNGIPLPFPRALSPNVWMVGHHSEKTFGAVPYLVKGRHRGKLISVLVDVPKFSKSAIQTVEDLCSSSSSSSTLEKGPDYMFLTHVDDTAQHLDWNERFPNMKRIFHSGDLGEHNWVGDESLEDVEILLHGSSDVANGELRAFSLDGATTDTIMKTHEGGDAKKMLLDVYEKVDSDFIILHTPGHSPGSISLLHKLDGGTIFTGDTYSYTTRGRGHMTGFPRYGNNLPLQARTLECLGGLAGAYDCIASGHGHPRNYRESDENADAIEDWKRTDIEDATSELRSYFQ